MKTVNDAINDDPSLLFEAPIKKISDKIYPTIPGILPYAKRKKFNIGDKLNIFDDVKFKWNKHEVEVKDIIVKQNEKFYIVNYKNNLLELSHRSLRRVDQNNDQVCRLKENGISKMPYPYSFYGLCSAGLNYFISPLGTCSRSDNRYYPNCEEITTETDNWIINFLLNGLSQNEKYISNINEVKINENGYDKYCGILNFESTKIGAVILAKLDNEDEYCEVKIIDKYKTHGLGNDNNQVYYKVIKLNKNDKINDDETDETNEEVVKTDDIYDIHGSNFHYSYVEKRNFNGILSFNNRIELLIECFIELGLTLPYINKLSNISNIKSSLKMIIEEPLSEKNFAKIMKKKLIMNLVPKYSILIRLLLKNGIIYYNENNIEIPIGICREEHDKYIYCYLYKQSLYMITQYNNEFIEIPFNIIINEFMEINDIKKYLRNKYNDDQSVIFYNETLKYPSIYRYTYDISTKIVLQTIKENVGIWTIGLLKSDNKNYYKIIETSLNIKNVKPEDYISLKINTLSNQTINNIQPIFRPKIVSSEHYKGISSTRKHVNAIFNPINNNMFKTGNFIINNKKIIINNDMFN